MTAATNDEGRGAHAAAEQELRALFAPRRPDAARFHAAVAARLAERARAGETDRSAASWRERAAALLPAMPPGGLPGPGWTAVLSLPGLLFLGSIAAFWRGDRSVAATLRKLAAGSESPRRTKPRATVSSGVSPRNRVAFACIAVGILLLGIANLAGPGITQDVILFGLCASMLVLAARVGALAQQRRTPAKLIGECVSDVVGAALYGMWAWRLVVMAPFDGDMAPSLPIVTEVLLLGFAGVQALRGWRMQRRWLMVVGLAGVTAVSALIGARVLWYETGVPALRRALAYAGTAAIEPMGWVTLAGFGDAVATAGQTLPEMPALRAAVEATIVPDSRSVHEWSAAARLGIVTTDQWRRIVELPFVQAYLPNLLRQRGRLSVFAHDEYLLPALLATHDLTDAERAHLMERIDASWAGAGAHPTVEFETAVVCLRWKKLLGGEVTPAQVAAIHDLLLRHAVGTGSSVGASGFTGIYGDVYVTNWAVAMIVGVGAPPQFDLTALASWLRAKARSYGPYSLPAADLAMLQQAFGLPSPTLLDRCVEERLLVGAVLFVLLALRAVWLARPTPLAVAGALP